MASPEEKNLQGDADGRRPRPAAGPGRRRPEAREVTRPRARQVPAPTLSVVIPTFNRLSFLPEAISSVLSQTWAAPASHAGRGDARQAPLLEIIVVDDGSTDGTPEYLADAAAAAPEVIRVVTLTHGGTPGRARNAGVAAARGDLIAFLDADDLWRSDKLEGQMALHRPKAAAVLSHTRETWLRGRRIVSQAGQEHLREGEVFADALHKCIIGPSTTVMERRVFEELGGFREDLEVAEDYELWVRLTHRHPVAYVDEELTIKRAGHGDQLSERYGAIEFFRIQGLRDLVEGGAFEDVPEHARAAARTLARKCRIYAQGCAKRGRLEEAQEYREAARFYERREGRTTG
ncbi:MAG: glycosyltransferase family 2 protein [Spirochaetaceae bacterium]